MRLLKSSAANVSVDCFSPIAARPKRCIRSSIVKDNQCSLLRERQNFADLVRGFLVLVAISAEIRTFIVLIFSVYRG